MDINHGNLLINKGTDNNFVYIPTKVDVEDLTNFEMSCTNRNGLLNRGWNCFYWKLSDQHSGKILQEVAELNPIKNLSVSQNSNINNNFTNYFSFFSRMRYGNLDDAAEKDGTRWLQMLIQKHHIYLVHTAKTTVLHFYHRNLSLETGAGKQIFSQQKFCHEQTMHR